MSEGFPARSEKEPTKKEKIIALAVEIIESHEVFSFHGLTQEAYSRLKADIARDEVESGYTTAMFDELVERFENEGMKVVLGKNLESGNVFFLPLQSNDIENDSIFPRYLQISEGMNEKLKELILLGRS